MTNSKHTDNSCVQCEYCVIGEATTDDYKYYCKRLYDTIPRLIRYGKIWCHCFVKKADEGVKDETD